jgi:hypothetical protein
MSVRWRAALSIALIPFACIRPTAAEQAQATACIPDSVNFCPIKIVNMTTIFSANQFQILAVAQKIDGSCQGRTAWH